MNVKSSYLNLICGLTIILLIALAILPAILQRDILELRLNMTIAAIGVGIILAISGAIYQSLFHNLLATPYTFGTAGACALAACISISLGVSPYLPSFIAALISISLITFLNYYYNANTLLVVGLIKGYLFSNLILLFQSMDGFSASLTSNKWILGSIGYLDLQLTIIIFVLAVLLIIVTSRYTREVSLIEIDREFAESLGINIKRTENILLLITGFCLSVVVSCCGTIGFIGIIIPVIIRKLNNNLSFLTIGLAGAAYLLLCVYLTRVFPLVPLAVITSLFGAPVFLALLLKKTS